MSPPSGPTPGSKAPAGLSARRAFEHRHVVGFEETNVVGNVYFAHYLSWQGECRERFLRQHWPDLMAELEAGMALVTVSCGCEFLAELRAFDEVAIRMRLVKLAQNRVTMGFEYWRCGAEEEELVARGEQQVAFMRRRGEAMDAVPVPAPLKEALEDYGAP